MKTNSLIRDLTVGSVVKNMITLSIPFILSNILQAAYSIVDMIVVGQFVGSDGLSAVSNTSQIIVLITSLGIGFTMGGQIVIAQLIGSGKREHVKSAIGNLFNLVVFISILMTVIGIVFSNQILKLIGTPSESYEYSKIFLVISCLGIFFAFGYNMVSAVLRGMGDSKRPFFFIAIASILNIILCVLFVGGFGWGVAGAASATVISQGVSFIISIIYLYKKRDMFEFDFKLNSFKIEKNMLISLARLGFPIGLQSAAINVSMLCVIGFINNYGVVASATFGVGRKIEQTGHIINQAVGYAATSMIGQNMGAQKYSRVKKSVNFTIGVAAVVFSILTVVLIFVPRQAFAIFTEDIRVLDMAKMLSYSLVLAVPANIVISAMNALMQGVGNAKLCFIIAFMDGVVTRITLCYLLGDVLGFGLQGYFYGYALAGYVTAIPGMIYFISGIWKKRRVIM